MMDDYLQEIDPLNKRNIKIRISLVDRVDVGGINTRKSMGERVDLLG